MSCRVAGSETGILEPIAAAAGRAGARAWLVGGAVRDLLLGRDSLDVDVALEGGASAADATVAALSAMDGWRCRSRHAAFGTATLEAPDGTRVDLAVTREETYARPGALPAVAPGAPIARDLWRRDFTIHAMALRLEGGVRVEGLLDPFGGQEDLALRRIRLLHEDSLSDDPTRAIRAARYAARLGFALDDGFEHAMRRAVRAGAFATISGDRLRRALEEVLEEENRCVAVALLESLSVPSAVLDGWSLAGARLSAAGRSPGGAGAWAELLAPASPAVRDAVVARLNFSRALRRAVGCPR